MEERDDEVDDRRGAFRCVAPFPGVSIVISGTGGLGGDDEGVATGEVGL
jgi:hypothetical protein